MDWQQKALQLAAVLRVQSLHPAVVERLRIDRTEHWGLACSGGADSVCMALVIWALFPSARKRMRILHFNHATRGAASAADEQWVRDLAQALDLGCEVGQRHPTLNSDVNEHALRQDRLAFFRETGCAYILTGHHLNDVAETLCMRLLRGSGVDGLSAPRPVSASGYGFVGLRPLLNLKRVTIEQALQQCGVLWREDASNSSPIFLRNRVRAAWIPLMQSLNERDFLQAAGRTRRLLEEDAVALDAAADCLFRNAYKHGHLDAKPLEGSAKALWRRVLHIWLNTVIPDMSMSAAAFEQLLERWMASEATQQSAGRSQVFRVEGSRLTLVAVPDRPVAWEAFWAEPGNSYPLPNAKSITIQRLTLDLELKKHILSGKINNETAVFIALKTGQFADRVLIRPWSPGDSYRPLGSPGRRKLQDVFVDKRIIEPERKLRPIVCLGQNDAIVWCPGIPPAESHKVTTTTKWALRLTYQSTS